MPYISRKYYIIIAAISLLAGLSILAFFNYPGFLRYHMSDILIIIFLYALLKSLVNIRPVIAVTAVLICGYLAELAQWFDLLGKLKISNSAAKVIVGTNFDWIDLVIYTVTSAVILCIEILLRKMNNRTNKD